MYPLGTSCHVEATGQCEDMLCQMLRACLYWCWKTRTRISSICFAQHASPSLWFHRQWPMSSLQETDRVFLCLVKAINTLRYVFSACLWWLFPASTGLAYQPNSRRARFPPVVVLCVVSRRVRDMTLPFSCALIYSSAADGGALTTYHTERCGESVQAQGRSLSSVALFCTSGELIKGPHSTHMYTDTPSLCLFLVSW